MLRFLRFSYLVSVLGWNLLRNLKNAAHLHDIGKIAIPDTILNKPSKLSEEEFSIIKEHTIIGANILKNISLIDHVQEIIRNHHEHDPYTKSQRKSRLFNWASNQK